MKRWRRGSGKSIRATLAIRTEDSHSLSVRSNGQWNAEVCGYVRGTGVRQLARVDIPPRKRSFIVDCEQMPAVRAECSGKGPPVSCYRFNVFTRVHLPDGHGPI